MKRCLRLLTISLLFITVQSFPQSPIVQSIINDTNIDSLVYRVRELSGDVPVIIGGSTYTIQSRNKYQPGNDMAANLIKEKFESYGLAAYDQWFSGTGRNVYGVQLGTVYPNQHYIICAHYDDMPSGTLAPGADDNASGTAAVLEAARIFSQYYSEYTIIYALWDEEEQGLVGSDYYAYHAYLDGDSIMGVINLDMIAWDSDNNEYADLHTKPIGSSIYIKDKMVETNNLYNLGLNIQIINPGGGGSDHWSFWNYNFGAILLIEDGSDFNAYYHSTSDLVIHFNQPFFLGMSKAAFGTLAVLANTIGIIPVELVSFSAVPSNDIVMLQWITATEMNNLGFEIGRAIDNNNFTTIGFVNGNGTTSEISNYSFSDNLTISGRHSIYYRLKQIDFDGTFNYSSIVKVEINTAESFTLSQNYPNPFNPATRITYSLINESKVSLKVYDFLGREIMTLVNEIKPAGIHEVLFDGSNLPSGTYFYTLISGNNISTKKMILIK